MRGLINAYGEKDTLGQDRVDEIRGLIEFGGKPVVIHTLDKLLEVEVDSVLLFCNEEHRAIYEETVQDCPIEVCVYEGCPNPMSVYREGLERLKGDDVIIVADDNLFDFSLEGLLRRFEEVADNTLVAKDLELSHLNFGRCQIDEEGKVLSASYSFEPETYMEEGLVICDIYLIHKKRVKGFLDMPLEEGVKEWFKNFYAWEADGFWADIGKKPLREMAERYFD